jgi:mono/diheme cytochrome c family protein
MAANGPRPINLRDPAWQASRTDQEIVAATRDGRGAMPSFNDVLTAEEIAAVSKYVRDLGAASK